MANSIAVRAAVGDEWAMLAAGNVAMARETEDKQLDAQVIEAGVKAVLSDPGKGLYFVAEIDGEAAGQAMVTTEWSDWRNGYFWWLQSVYVQPAFRRRGVFRAMYAHIRAQAQAAGNVCGLRLYVERENTGAIGTYEAMDMVDAGYVLMEEDWSK